MKAIIVSTLYRSSDAFLNTWNKNSFKFGFMASHTNRNAINSPALPGLLTCGSFPQLRSLLGDIKERQKVPCKLCTNNFKGIMRRNRTSVLWRRRRPLYAGRHCSWGHWRWKVKMRLLRFPFTSVDASWIWKRPPWCLQGFIVRKLHRVRPSFLWRAWSYFSFISASGCFVKKIKSQPKTWHQVMLLNLLLFRK